MKQVMCIKDGFMKGNGEQFATKGKKYEVLTPEYSRSSEWISIRDDRGYDHSFDLSTYGEWYIPADQLDIGQALAALESGQKLARAGWNGKGIFIELQRPDAHSKMTHPYIYIDTTGLQSDNPDAPRSLVPWLASQTDILAKDWVIVE